MAEKPIPKAADYFRGNINEAVILVQQMTGVEITPKWWDQKVGNHGTAEEILSRFDRAYLKEVRGRQNP